MTVKINVRFENGVFIPESPVALPEHSRLALTYEELPPPAPITQQRWDDPNDPMPAAGGAALLEWWDRHRLQIDPVIGDRIARSKAYEYYEEPADES